ncbi:MAG TPA: DUF1992 domain-containing protein [Pirellulales bacterium]|nr:DUF1992 domain-containing protein [Pirellulales bacterium]
MTRQKPPGVSWQSFIERQILDAYAAGDFENLPGFGKPIPELDEPDDELWWVKNLVKRERLSVVPPSLEILREVEKGLERVWTLSYESDVRQATAVLNEKIRKANFAITGGPPSTMGDLNVDEIVEHWHAKRTS